MRVIYSASFSVYTADASEIARERSSSILPSFPRLARLFVLLSALAWFECSSNDVLSTPRSNWFHVAKFQTWATVQSGSAFSSLDSIQFYLLLTAPFRSVVSFFDPPYPSSWSSSRFVLENEPENFPSFVRTVGESKFVIAPECRTRFGQFIRDGI